MLAHRPLLMALLTTVVLNGEIPLETFSVVLEDLRAVAVKAGCPADRVRAEARWRGGDTLAELVIWCAKVREMPPNTTESPPR